MVGALGCVIVSLALAADPAEGTQSRALELFEQSAVAYREGRFDDAIALLREARAQRPEPVLLYNLGRAYEAAGRRREAAEAYTQYLAEEPNARDRGSLEGRIATLRREEEERDTLLRASNKEPDRSAEPAPVAVGPLPFVVAGVGLLAVGTGVGLGAHAQSRADAAAAEPVQTTAVDVHDGARGLATAANVVLIAGAALTIVGATWIGVRWLAPSQKAVARGGLVWEWP
jgi:tetratricopeptide (TPR) repeat protein